MGLEIIPFSKRHNRNLFDCGPQYEALNGYLKNQVSQDIKRKLSTCFYLIDTDTDPERIIGYYTLSNAAISRSDLPEGLLKKYGSTYNNLPVTLLGRLAIDREFAKQGYGKLLLVDALKRCLLIASTDIGSMAVVVDPKDQASVDFYSRYGFILLPDSGKMIMSMNTIAKAIGS